MTLVDSSGWVHYFANGPLAERYAVYLSDQKNVLTPTLVLYEVYKILKRELGSELTLDACTQLERTNLVPLSPEIAYRAADLSLEHKLSMADAMIYAVADLMNAELVTSDADFKDLPGVLYLKPDSEEI